MPEMLSEAGYVTGMFGKWHLGDRQGRFPTDQGGGEPIKDYGMPLFIELHTDMKEEYPTQDSRWIENTWVRWPAGQVLLDHQKSLQEEPAIRPGTPDPYVPAK